MYTKTKFQPSKKITHKLIPNYITTQKTAFSTAPKTAQNLGKSSTFDHREKPPRPSNS